MQTTQRNTLVFGGAKLSKAKDVCLNGEAKVDPEHCRGTAPSARTIGTTLTQSKSTKSYASQKSEYLE